MYAHNGGRFDEHLILRELYRNDRAPDDITMAGNKIFEMKFRQTAESPKIMFRDTFLMMMAPLDRLKDIFNLEHVENKHYFPVNITNVKYMYSCFSFKVSVQ